MALSSSTEIGHLGFVVLSDLSRTIFDALDEALPNDECQLVWRVDVSEGWGGCWRQRSLLSTATRRGES